MKSKRAHSGLLSTSSCFAVVACAVLMFSGCATSSETIPVSTKNTWVFDADFKTKAVAHVTIGTSREDVISSLGDPESRENFTSDPSVEVLHFVRVAIGPRRVRSVLTAGGTMNIVDNTRYYDEIAVYLKGGVVASVTLHRTVQKPTAPADYFR